MTVGRRIMFRKSFSNACFTIFLLLLAGCGMNFGGNNGSSPNVVIDLTEEYELHEIVDTGDFVAVDMVEPTDTGYRITGTYFDPKTIRLVSFEKGGDRNRPRIRYVFEALDKATTTLLFNIEPVAGGLVETYKRVTLSIKDD